MDPANAVGIAAAVIQFADYGFRLIKDAHELYSSSSGQKSEHIQLSVVSQNLSDLADAIGGKLDESQGSAGEIILRLHGECKSTNDELQSILRKLRVKVGSNKIELALDGLRVAFRQVAAADDIEKLEDRLNRIREEMNVGLMYLLLDEAGKNGVELRQIAKQQADMITTLDRIDTTTKQFSPDFIGLIDDWLMNNQRETYRMVRYVLSDKWQTTKYAHQTVFDESQDNEKLRKVCQSLYFESINHRETGISKRHASTFEWIFHKPRTLNDGHALWSDFPLWLQGESRDIYWITGKPGAGKSTLAKFISQDSRFKVLLEKWATGSQLLIIRYFSWTSGMNKLQKSQEGLFRTLLLQAIQQRPQLTIDIFPARWFLLQSFNGNIELPPLTIDELRDGFQKLLSATGDFKLALLIDGLDEFDEDHNDLVHLLSDANKETGVKICTSSRPWNIFRDAYSKNPMLQLENLTRDDIESFVSERLQLSQGYSDFAATNSKAAGKIINDIVEKSQGVFLWVSVISGLLETALQEGTSILDLQTTIDNLPSEVADLFRYIWNRTSKRFRSQASQYFRLMRSCQEHEIDLLALILWFGDVEISVHLNAADVTSDYLTGAIKTLERRLMSRTGGLLELVSRNGDYAKEPKDFRVDYMHRTANDWVRDNWESISSATDPGFDPLFWFIKGQALSITLTTEPNVENFLKLTDWSRVFKIASLVSEEHPDKEILVVALDRLDHHLVNHTKDHVAYHWLNRVQFPPNQRKTNANFVGEDSKQQIAVKTLACCTDFFEFSARIPIVAYLKQKVQENPRLFSKSSPHGVSILYNVIFGEVWFNNAKARLNILNFLVQGKYCPSLESLRIIKDKAKYAVLVLRNSPYSDSDMSTYFTQAESILESRIGDPPVNSSGWLEWKRYSWWPRRQ
ncbi:hypothetical protein V8C40DRAFT_65726 [Trichoderma camerunense]